MKMNTYHGKLILLNEDGPEQEYELSKTSITLGRAMTNDIILNDSRISRSHARLECGPQGCELVDLGSSNGSWLNGFPINRAVLRSGDQIALGSLNLRYETDRPTEMVEVTMINSEAELTHTINHEILPVALNDNQVPRLVVYNAGKTWDVRLDQRDSLDIGRSETNTIVLEHPKVSRYHAQVDRKGNIYVLRDLGSTNGTWHREQKVDELILQDGDEFIIGEARLVFKSGFPEEALTLAEDLRDKLPARRPVVFVPGFMGSQLWIGSERVWPNIMFMLKEPHRAIYNETSPIVARGIVDEVVVVPNLVKLDQYNRLGDYLVEDLGYERGKDFFEFAYDWRQDVRLSAAQLGQMIDSLGLAQPVIIIAHSLGTLVSRYYIERLGGKKKVERAILMGGPHQGVPKALVSLLTAPDGMPFGLVGERIRQVILTFPSCYQILPTYACATDQNGNKINFMEDESWLTETQVPLLRAAREFRKELGMRSSVPAISIFGYGLKTLSSFSFVKPQEGKLRNIVYKNEPSGDSSIPEHSAVLPGSEIHPVQQYHGSLFVDNDVKMRLKLELTRLMPR
jgi:pSer/pThr/pTyr-binding forkhead associated (FHA) protein